jgi:hypothetical protein
MRETLNSCKILVGKSYGIETIGRPTYRWAVKMKGVGACTMHGKMRMHVRV